MTKLPSYCHFTIFQKLYLTPEETWMDIYGKSEAMIFFVTSDPPYYLCYKTQNEALPKKNGTRGLPTLCFLAEPYY